MNSLQINQYSQTGASLIEVLIAILLLSFGMLSIGAMVSFAVQMPKLAGYRATATNLATSHIERIRANPDGFNNDSYSTALGETSWSFREIQVNECFYLVSPKCDEALQRLPDMDNAATRREIRQYLPAGDMLMNCGTSPCSSVTNSYGNLWIVWQEPNTYAALDPSTSDNCPAQVTAVYTNPKPRCLYVRFKI